MKGSDRPTIANSLWQMYNNGTIVLLPFLVTANKQISQTACIVLENLWLGLVLYALMFLHESKKIMLTAFMF